MADVTPITAPLSFAISSLLGPDGPEAGGPAGPAGPIGAAAPVPTPTMRAFGCLLDAAAALVGAERELAGYSGQDPAVDAWIIDAERARGAVLEAVAGVRAAVALRRADRALKRVAWLFGAVMGSACPDEVEGLRRRMGFIAVRCAEDPVLAVLAGSALERLDRLLALDAGVPPEPWPEPELWPDPGLPLAGAAVFSTGAPPARERAVPVPAA